MQKSQNKRRSNMIKYEQMPPSAQKSYDMTNKVRVVSMFIAAALTVFLSIRGIIKGSGVDIFTFMLGGVIHYFIHAEFLLKKLMNSLGILGILAFLIISVFGMYTGWIFMIVDFILFLMKKPCIYPFENESFLLSKKAQEEIDAINLQATANAYAQAVREINGTDNIKDSLEQLKEMLDNGLITESEYEAKKAELLERL